MALNHPESGFFSDGDMVLRSANPIRGDGHYTSGGDFRIEKLNGNLGTLISPFDPVIQASGDVSFSSYTGASLHVLAGGSVNIGSVTITDIDVTNYINQTITLSDGTPLEVNGGARPTLDIRAGTTAFDSPLGLQGLPTPSDLSLLDAATSAEIAIDSITLSAADGLVLLTNQYNPNLALPDGTIQVGQINTSSSIANGGDVVIDSRGGIVLTGNVNSQSTGAASNSGGVTLLANEDITTTNIQSDSSFLDGGQISLTSRHGAIDTSAGSLTSFAGSPGRSGGQISLSAESDITVGNINSSGGNLGGGGDITLVSNGRVSATNSLIQSSTFGLEKGGDITITAELLSLAQGAFLSASTYSTGDAGNVNITAMDTVFFDGTNNEGKASGAFTQVKQGAQGSSGNLNITTGSLYVTNGAALNTSTAGRGDAGDVNIIATDIVSFDGADSNGLSSRATSRMISQEQNQNKVNGGNLNITTGSLFLTNGAALSASTFGYGDAGDINITATDTIFLDNSGSNRFEGAIVSRAVGNTAQGNGGNINITTGSLYVTNGAQLSASSSGLGNAGNLNIVATDTLSFDGLDTEGNPSLVGSRVGSLGTGNGGNVNITTQYLSVTNGALISTTSFGQGNAGNIEITADSVVLDNPGKLTARTTSGNGGNISLQVEDVLLLRNNSVISTDAGAGGDGGNITINAGFIVAVPQENSDIIANAYQGRGGRVEITTQGIFGLRFQNEFTESSDITASSSFGLSGTVKISRLALDPSQGLTSLPTDVVDPTAMIDYQCQVGRSSTENKFTMTGRGGLPPNPNEPLGEEDWLEDLGSPMEVGEVGGAGEAGEIVSPVVGNASASSPKQIVEAQSWMIDSDGRVALTVQVPAHTPVTATSQQTWQAPASCQNIPNTASLTASAY